MCLRRDLSRQEVYGLSCILRRLTATFHVGHFKAVGAVQLETLLQAVAHLACLSAEKAVKEVCLMSRWMCDILVTHVLLTNTLLPFSCWNSDNNGSHNAAAWQWLSTCNG